MAESPQIPPGKCPNLIPDDKKYLDRIIAGYSAGFIILLITVAIVTYLSKQMGSVIKLIIYCSCSGGLGGLMYSIYGYVDHHGKCDFSIAYFWWYIFRPVLGIILGLFCVFFIACGLISLSGQPADSFVISSLHTQSILFYCALAFLTGYASKSFLVKLRALAHTLFEGDDGGKEPKENKNPQT